MNTNKNKKMLPYLIIAIASFYILPLLGKNTGYFIRKKIKKNVNLNI